MWIERLIGKESPAETDTDADKDDCEASGEEPVEDDDFNNELEDDSTTPEATGLAPVRPRITREGCPYSLRKKISAPKRYQQARDDLKKRGSDVTSVTFSN